jgi:hypothetical protein
MADRDPDRTDTGARAERRADRLTVLHERRMRAAPVLRRARRADEHALRDADRRQVERHAEVTRETEAPRMRQAVTVGEDQIRARAQAREGAEERRYLAEREIAGDVREARLATDAARLDDGERGGVEHHDRRVHPRRAAVPGDVGAGDEADASNAVARLDAVAKLLLQRARRRDGRHGRELYKGAWPQVDTQSVKASKRSLAWCCLWTRIEPPAGAAASLRPA